MNTTAPSTNGFTITIPWPPTPAPEPHCPSCGRCRECGQPRPAMPQMVPLPLYPMWPSGPTWIVPDNGPFLTTRSDGEGGIIVTATASVRDVSVGWN